MYINHGPWTLTVGKDFYRHGLNLYCVDRREYDIKCAQQALQNRIGNVRVLSYYSLVKRGYSLNQDEMPSTKRIKARWLRLPNPSMYFSPYVELSPTTPLSRLALELKAIRRIGYSRHAFRILPTVYHGSKSENGSGGSTRGAIECFVHVT